MNTLDVEKIKVRNLTVYIVHIVCFIPGGVADTVPNPTRH